MPLGNANFSGGTGVSPSLGLALQRLLGRGAAPSLNPTIPGDAAMALGIQRSPAAAVARKGATKGMRDYLGGDVAAAQDMIKALATPPAPPPGAPQPGMSGPMAAPAGPPVPMSKPPMPGPPGPMAQAGQPGAFCGGGKMKRSMKRGGKGAFSAGGRVLGPGDGRSDSIPMPMADGGQAALSADEYVIPAWAVSAMGKGSSEAGAKMLDAHLDQLKNEWAGDVGAFPGPKAGGNKKGLGGIFKGEEPGAEIKLTGAGNVASDQTAGILKSLQNRAKRGESDQAALNQDQLDYFARAKNFAMNDPTGYTAKTGQSAQQLQESIGGIDQANANAAAQYGNIAQGQGELGGLIKSGDDVRRAIQSQYGNLNQGQAEIGGLMANADDVRRAIQSQYGEVADAQGRVKSQYGNLAGQQGRLGGAQDFLSSLYAKGGGEDALINATLADFDQKAGIDTENRARQRLVRGAFGARRDVAESTEMADRERQRALTEAQLRAQGIDRKTAATAALGNLAGVSGNLTGQAANLAGTQGQLSGVSGQLSGQENAVLGTQGQLVGTRGALTNAAGNLAGQETGVLNTQTNAALGRGQLAGQAGNLAGTQGQLASTRGNLAQAGAGIAGDVRNAAAGDLSILQGVGERQQQQEQARLDAPYKRLAATNAVLSGGPVASYQTGGGPSAFQQGLGAVATIGGLASGFGFGQQPQQAKRGGQVKQLAGKTTKKAMGGMMGQAAPAVMPAPQRTQPGMIGPTMLPQTQRAPAAMPVPQFGVSAFASGGKIDPASLLPLPFADPEETLPWQYPGLDKLPRPRVAEKIPNIYGPGSGIMSPKEGLSRISSPGDAMRALRPTRSDPVSEFIESTMGRPDPISTAGREAGALATPRGALEAIGNLADTGSKALYASEYGPGFLGRKLGLPPLSESLVKAAKGGDYSPGFLGRQLGLPPLSGKIAGMFRPEGADLDAGGGKPNAVEMAAMRDTSLPPPIPGVKPSLPERVAAITAKGPQARSVRGSIPVPVSKPGGGAAFVPPPERGGAGVPEKKTPGAFTPEVLTRGAAPAGEAAPSGWSKFGAGLSAGFDNPLTQFGLALLASQNPNAAGAIGEAGLVAGKFAGDKKARERAERREARLDKDADTRLGLEYERLGLSKQQAAAAVARDNAAIQDREIDNARADRALGVTEQRAKSLEGYQQAQLGLAGQRNALTAANNASLAEARKRGPADPLFQAELADLGRQRAEAIGPEDAAEIDKKIADVRARASGLVLDQPEEEPAPEEESGGLLGLGIGGLAGGGLIGKPKIKAKKKAKEAVKPKALPKARGAFAYAA